MLKGELRPKSQLLLKMIILLKNKMVLAKKFRNFTWKPQLACYLCQFAGMTSLPSRHGWSSFIPLRGWRHLHRIQNFLTSKLCKKWSTASKFCRRFFLRKTNKIMQKQKEKSRGEIMASVTLLASVTQLLSKDFIIFRFYSYPNHTMRFSWF